MKNKFLTYLTIMTYMLLSIVSANSDVLCTHESGYSSFETMINSECVEIKETNYQNELKIPNNKITNNDICSDIEILKGIISYQSSLFSDTLLSYNSIITDYVKYIKTLDINRNQEFYVINTKNKNFTEKSYCNHISTFVLLT